MDKTQLYIIKQSCLNRATDLYSKSHSWSEEQIIQTAEIFKDWVCGEKQNTVADYPVISDESKKWLNQNTPEYTAAIEHIKSGGSIKSIRNTFKVSKKVADELAKL